jgi:alpha-L-fucosidase
MAWWRDAKFGMFIHWSLPSVYAGEWKGKRSGGDWLMFREKASVGEYAEAAKRFNPVNFNADEWVALAKAGGMKYIVITSKHHDGFTMFPSKASAFNLHDATPFKRDVFAELSAACRKAGLKFGVYYSQAQDWHHAGGYQPTVKWHGENGSEPGEAWDPAQEGDHGDYVKNVAAVHVRELVENYHPDILWWDYPTLMPEESIKALREPLAKLPNIISNSRLGNGVKGDFWVFERHVPDDKIAGRDWESCGTMNDSWGYVRQDKNYKSAGTMVKNLVEIVSKGGNFLLNVGPDATGTIPPEQVELTRQIGGWLHGREETIYGTTNVPLTWQPDNQWLVAKGETCYLHMFDWKRGPARLPGLVTELASATTFTGGERLAIGKDPEGFTTIAVPAKPDALDTVVVLKFKGPMKTTPVVAECWPEENGTIAAPAINAALAGKLKLGGDAPNKFIWGWWTEATDQPTWKLMVPPGGGEYSVELTYGCADKDAGSSFEIVAGDSKIRTTLQGTGSEKTKKRATVPGLLRLPGGPQTLTLIPLAIINGNPKGNSLQLRDITLTPVKK